MEFACKKEFGLDTYRKRFWISLLILTALRLFFIGQFELSPDEAYYWTWSRHLDWSYYDQGPMLALVIRFFTSLVNASTEWSVRLGSVACSVLSSWFFFELIRRIFRSTRAAWYGFLAMQASLLFAVGAVLMMHDSLMMCFWIGGLLAFYRATTEDWTPGWGLGALALGLGALSKYTMALFVPSLLLFLVLSPRQRVWWRRPHLYLAGLGTLLFVVPILIWNAQHGWASFGHVAGLGGARKVFSISYKTVLDFIGGQLGVMTPVIGALAAAAPVLAWKFWRTRREPSEGYLFLACFSAPVLFFFLLLSLNTSIYANWTAPAYPAALAVLAGWLEHLRTTPTARKALGWTRTALITGAVLTLLVHLEAGWGILPLTGRVAGSVDRIRGWRTVGLETGRRLVELNRNGQTYYLGARRYQIAAILSFYTPGQPEVQLFPLKKPAGNQYRFWDRSDQLTGRDILYVCEDYWEYEHLRPFFRQVNELIPFQVRLQGRTLREIRYFLAGQYDPRGPNAVGFAQLTSSEGRP